MYGIVKNVWSTKKRFGPADVYKVPVQMTTRSQVLLLNSDFIYNVVVNLYNTNGRHTVYTPGNGLYTVMVCLSGHVCSLSIFWINEFSRLLNHPLVQTWKSVPTLFVQTSEISGLSEPGLTNHHCNNKFYKVCFTHDLKISTALCLDYACIKSQLSKTRLSIKLFQSR